MRKGNHAVCDNMDETWGHYTKWDKSDREGQIVYDLTYMWESKKAELIETGSWMVVARGWGQRK